MDAQSVASYNQRRLEVVDLNPITSFQIALQMVHRLVAALILLGVAGSAWLAWRTTGLRSLVTRLSLGWVALILVQALLGVATIWSNKAADIATAHVLVGALALATSAALSIILTKDLLNQTRPSLQSATRQNDLASSFAAHPASAVGLK
jgi:cytochrome c oxidase assembly protein subunit 15